jgi:membrane protein
MSELVKKINYFLTSRLWSIDTSALNSTRSFLVNLVRFVYVTVREFRENELTLRSMSLVYTTLLSLVPLLAFSISILKAFGVVENKLEPFLLQFLAPLGPKGAEITSQILEFIGRINFGVLGFIGLLLLIYTSVSVINKIEDSLNKIWKVKKGRGLARRFSDYLTILLIGPVLMVAALGVMATLESNTVVTKILSIEPLGTIVLLAWQLIPYFFVVLVFSFIYVLIPNTKVNVKSALVGGAIGGLAWHIASWGFTISVASSTKYAAIYSSLALLIIFMIWLYLNWLIVLIGAEIAYCFQNLKYLTVNKEVIHLTTKLREKLSFVVMFLIGYSFYHGKDRWTLHSITEHLKLPKDPVEDAVKELKEGNLIIETGDEPPYLVPSMSLEKIKLKEILGSTRTGYQTDELEDKYLSIPEVDSVSSDVERAIDQALGEKSLRDMVSKDSPRTD